MLVCVVEIEKIEIQGEENGETGMLNAGSLDLPISKDTNFGEVKKNLIVKARNAHRSKGGSRMC